jgi:formyl-CoA transferase
MSTTGTNDGPPTRIGPTIGDVGTGVQMALAITAAYVHKLRTGQGQLIEISMQEAVTYFMRTTMAIGSKWGTRPAERRGNGNNPVVNLFPCKPFGPNDYVYIMCVTQKMFETLCSVIGREDLRDDPHFATHRARRDNADALRAEIERWTRARTKREAMHALCEGNVPASAVFDTTDLFTDPHLLERGFVHKVRHEELGHVPLLGWPPRMSASHVPIVAAPVLGKHSAEVVAQDLGLSDAEIAALRARGVLGPEREAPVRREN